MRPRAPEMVFCSIALLDLANDYVMPCSKNCGCGIRAEYLMYIETRYIDVHSMNLQAY